MVWLATFVGLGLFGGGQQLVMPHSSTVPAAHIQLNLGTDGNGNTTVDLKAQYLAQPASLSPPAAVYLVWVEPQGQPPERKGLLRPDANLNAELKFVTPASHFVLLISAESSTEATTPSGVTVATGAIARAEK